MASPLIVLVGADKGGVGKTTVSRGILDYVEMRGSVSRAFDTEPGEGALRRFFPATEQLNVDTVPGQMKLVDAANNQAVTVVDCKAGLMTPIMRAFARIKLLDDVKSGALRLLIFHVVGPTVASGLEIDEIAAGFAGAKVVHVRNKINPDAKFAPASGTVIDISNLDEESCETVDQLGVSFAKFSIDTKQSRVLRGYVGAWLDEVYAALDAAGLGALLRE